MNNQSPNNSSNAPTSSSSIPTQEDFAQAMNHISNFLRVLGNPFATRHFGNETYYNSMLSRINGIERYLYIYFTVMIQQAREFQERVNESKTHAQTELLVTREKRTLAQIDSRARQADDRLAEEKEKLAEESRPKKRAKRSFIVKDLHHFPPPPPPSPPPPVRLFLCSVVTSLILCICRVLLQWRWCKCWR